MNLTGEVGMRAIITSKEWNIDITDLKVSTSQIKRLKREP
jgi:hypothetical protein